MEPRERWNRESWTRDFGATFCRTNIADVSFMNNSMFFVGENGVIHYKGNRQITKYQILSFCSFFQVRQRMRVRSPRLVVLQKSQVSSAARSRATARCLSRLQCPAPPRLRRLRAPLPPLQRRRPSSPRVHASPRRLPSASRGSSIHRPLSLPLPCWGHRPAPSPTLLIHARTRKLALFHHRSTTRRQ